MNTALALRHAADLLSLKGAWGQRSYCRILAGRECFCALGALARVTGATDGGEAGLFLGQHIDPTSPEPHAAVIAWNDAEGTTQVEVVKIMREAADAANLMVG